MSHTVLRTTTNTLIRELKYYFLSITVRCQLRIVLHDQLRHRQPQSPTTGFNILTPSRRVVLEDPTVFLLGKKLFSFDGNRTSIIAFTGSRPKPRLCEMIRNRIDLTVKSCQHLAQQPNWRPTPCLLSATVYSIYS
jgi:hypothetical protein